MTHLDEERLVALCFGDGTPADAAHAASCAECAAAADRLRAMLAAVEPGDIPERGEDYGRVVWERLQARLEAERRWMRRSALRRRTVTWGALAASLLVAFLAGREFPRPAPPVAEAIPEAARERILLLAVGDHLERSQVLLVELTNAGPGAGAGRARGAGVGGGAGDREPAVSRERGPGGGHRRGQRPGGAGARPRRGRAPGRPTPRRRRWSASAGGSRSAGSCSRSASSSPRSASVATTGARRPRFIQR